MSDSQYVYAKKYTATVTLTAADGWTFTGLAEDSFTHEYADRRPPENPLENPKITNNTGETLTVSIAFVETPKKFEVFSNASNDSAIDMIEAAKAEQGVFLYCEDAGTENVKLDKDDISVNGLTLDLNNTSPARVVIDGGGRVIDLTGIPTSKPLIIVNAGVTLTLRNITFKGLKKGGEDVGNNTASLIQVSGTLILDNGAVITNNVTSSGGGGVRVYMGNLIMENGSEVSNNTSSAGGGVYVFNGTFSMNGGTISGNTAVTYGGGVSVAGSSTFTKTGNSIIYGANAGALKNTSNAGHAAWVVTGSKKRDDTAGKGYNLDSTKTDDGGWD
ncbi:MAG: hypothetical protein LBT00_12135 [Spirochaetaceae bacterium]|jgi:hypothetical protein|nr:hypothetical protein [Spirochaetaceae bacterium]